jgi:hypothetical protein
MMTETTITAKKSETTSDARTDCAELMTARHADREISRTAFGMRTSNRKQLKTTDMTTQKQIYDGGPAFPATCSPEGIPLVVSYPSEIVSGMTLRDYLAAAALQSIWTNVHCTPTVKFDEIATRAYQQADAMLSCRKEGV